MFPGSAQNVRVIIPESTRCMCVDCLTIRKVLKKHQTHQETTTHTYNNNHNNRTTNIAPMWWCNTAMVCIGLFSAVFSNFAMLSRSHWPIVSTHRTVNHAAQCKCAFMRATLQPPVRPCYRKIETWQSLCNTALRQQCCLQEIMHLVTECTK